MVTEGRKYDLYSQDFFADAYATFAQMREHDPVFCQPGLDGETPIWWVTRYEDAEAVMLDDERFVRDPRLALPPEQLAESFTKMASDSEGAFDSFGDSLANVLATGEFVVNLAPEQLLEEINATATDFPSGANWGSETRATFEKSSSVNRRGSSFARVSTISGK